MTIDFLLIAFCVVASLCIAVLLDRRPQLTDQLPGWPIRRMPATNGVTVALVFIVAATGLLLLVKAMP